MTRFLPVFWACTAMAVVAPAALAAQALPLKPTRTITFTTDEGTDLSLDVSPDGRTIVFDLLGDLYTLPITGGPATRLTQGPAMDATPRFSPDGTQIAYISDQSGVDNVWLIGLVGGTPRRQLTHETVHAMKFPLWAPDGRSLLVQRELTRPSPDEAAMVPELLRLDARSGAAERVLADGYEHLAGAAVSPDGLTVYVNHGVDHHYQLARLDLRSRRLTPLPTAAPPTWSPPLVSPDGRWLVYTAEPTRGSRHNRLVDLWDRSPQPDRVVMELVNTNCNTRCTGAFTPDSRALIVADGGKIKRLDLGTLTVTDLPFTVTVRAMASPLVSHPRKLDDGPVTIRRIQDIASSPDGQWLAFSAVGKVWIMPRHGTPRRLTPGALNGTVLEFDPVFSPDGQWIAFATWSDSVGSHLWKARLAGGPATRLTSSPAAQGRGFAAPRWTPDGRRLVFYTSAVDHWGKASVDGKEFAGFGWISTEGDSAIMLQLPFRSSTRHARARVRVALDLTVSRDGARVYFLHDRLLKSLGWEAQEDPDVRIHARFVGDVAEAIPSPDGQWVALEYNFNVYLAPLAPVAPRARASGGDEASAPVIVLPGYGPGPEQGRGVMAVTTDGGLSPNWSPDGRWLTWHSENRHYRAALDDLVARKGRAAREEHPIALRVPRALPTGTLVLRGARIVTMAAHGIQVRATPQGTTVVTDPGVIERGDLVITGRRITAVGPAGAIPVPVGATVIDATGTTIIPGLIGGHEDIGKFFWPSFFPDIQRGSEANLRYGVTTQRFTGGGMEAPSREEWQAAGQRIGPRLFSPLTTINRHTHYPDYRNAELMGQAMRSLQASGASFVKQATLNRIQLQAFILAADRAGLPTTSDGCHLRVCVGLMLDGTTAIEHQLGGDHTLYRDVVELMARTGTTTSPAIGERPRRLSQLIRSNREQRTQTPPDEQTQQDIAMSPVRKSALRLLRAGGNVIVGSHSGLGEGLVADILSFAAAGMTTAEALRCGTLNVARTLGLAADLGSIEVGKIADVVVLNSNPLEDLLHLTDIRYTIKDGFVYDGRTLDVMWPVPQKYRGPAGQ